MNVGVEPYLAGEELEILYTVENQFVDEQRITLEEDLNAGDTLFYTFPNVVPLDEAGETFDVNVLLEATASQDPNNGEIVLANNDAAARITTTSNSGLDMRVTSLSLTSDNVCGDASQSRIQLGIQNTGCSEISEGDYPIIITAAGSEYNYEIRLPFDLRAGSFATIFDVIVLPDEIQNGEELMVTLAIPVSYTHLTLPTKA